MKVDLEAFWRTGVFGLIRLGMTPADVLDIVGEPEDRTVPSISPEIWKLGPCEVMFEHNRVISIEVKPDEHDRTWNAIDLEPESLRRLGSMTPATFSDYAQRAGLAIVRTVHPSYRPDATTILLENCVRIVFEGEHMMATSVLAPIEAQSSKTKR